MLEILAVLKQVYMTILCEDMELRFGQNKLFIRNFSVPSEHTRRGHSPVPSLFRKYPFLYNLVTFPPLTGHCVPPDQGRPPGLCRLFPLRVLRKTGEAQGKLQGALRKVGNKPAGEKLFAGEDNNRSALST